MTFVINWGKTSYRNVCSGSPAASLHRKRYSVRPPISLQIEKSFIMNVFFSFNYPTKIGVCPGKWQTLSKCTRSEYPSFESKFLANKIILQNEERNEWFIPKACFVAGQCSNSECNIKTP